MHEARDVQPRQIYVSTVTRRDRRWTRKRGRGPLSIALLSAARSPPRPRRLSRWRRG